MEIEEVNHVIGLMKDLIYHNISLQDAIKRVMEMLE